MFYRLLSWVLPVLVAAATANAADAPILTVIKTKPDGTVTRMEINGPEFFNFPTVTFRARTDFTSGETVFSGPLVRTVLGESALRGARSARLTALNDYAVDIPVEDFLSYDAILATSVNGQRLTVRDKGPIWLMYPISDHPELQNTRTNAKLIWQLAKIEIR